MNPEYLHMSSRPITEDCRMTYRAGIAIGDIIVEDDDIDLRPGLLALANSGSYRLTKGAIPRGRSSA